MKTIKSLVISITTLVVGMSFVLLLFTSFKNTDVSSNTPTKHVVSIYQMKFTPEKIQVKKGDVVEWINKDFVPHDVTEINKKWTSKPLKQGETFSKVITNNFDYFCSIHIVMKGSVTVKN
ncbi:plastocyanin [Aequorivita sublithincola DSM 14238]|uniref:Plastocyanin n=1 Tax=Aequorivita sublithincola (strain DSM 14238 / LMG 21431 / ACAM 643 / 9-3) TaxID=746697 RepID=I3YZJ2_AEQSU|nr:plastocyanin/azurin family copper-binding protein [Aequorivita sublithincola]AFL82410.1 plastocyanin [Aequorivita sublithincola DSM 14238]